MQLQLLLEVLDECHRPLLACCSEQQEHALTSQAAAAHTIQSYHEGEVQQLAIGCLVAHGQVGNVCTRIR